MFDGLRAVAALSVVGFHAAFYSRVGYTDNVLRPYAAHLDVGVTIFFLISGFLLYRPFVRARLRQDPMPATGAYAWRRFLRIVPAYWVALTVVTIWLSLPHVFTASGIPAFYGFAQIYDAQNGLRGISQAWTLCVEVTFYAFLPLWALAMRRLRAGDRRRMLTQEMAGLAVLFVASTAYKVWALRQVAPNDLRQGPYLQPLPNFLDQFALGMGLAVLSIWWEGRERLPGAVDLLRRRPTISWLLAGAAFWAVSTRIGLTGEYFPRVYPSHTFLERHELYSLVALGVYATAFGWLIHLGFRVPQFGAWSWVLLLSAAAAVGQQVLSQYAMGRAKDKSRVAMWGLLATPCTIVLSYILVAPELPSLPIAIGAVLCCVGAFWFSRINYRGY